MGTLIGIIIASFIAGGLARFALPGPDPMPWWATLLLGFLGGIVGGAIFWILLGANGGIIAAFVGAVLLLVLYRRFVQKRPLTGPRAHERPRRGVGL